MFGTVLMKANRHKDHSPIHTTQNRDTTVFRCQYRTYQVDSEWWVFFDYGEKNFYVVQPDMNDYRTTNCTERFLSM